MKEQEFRHFYGFDDPKNDLAPYNRNLSRVMYIAFPIRFGQVLKQDVSNKDIDHYKSKAFEFCMNDIDLTISIIPLYHNHFIIVPLAITHPIGGTKRQYHNGEITCMYTMRFSSSSLHLVHSWHSHRDTIQIYFDGYMNKERKDLFFSYRRCVEFCDQKNGSHLPHPSVSTIHYFFSRCYENATILKEYMNVLERS